MDKLFEEDFRAAPKRFKIATIVLLALISGFMIWYTYSIVSRFVRDHSNPGNTVTYETSKTLDYPTITICNLELAQDIELVACTRFEQVQFGPLYKTDCTEEVVLNLDFTFKALGYKCLQVNGKNVRHRYTAKNSGFQNSIDVELIFHTNVSSNISIFRGGAVLFHEPDISHHQLLDKILQTSTFLLPGAGVIASLQRILIINIEGDERIDYLPTVGQLGLHNSLLNQQNNSNYCYFSTSYARLETQKVQATYIYSVESVLGEFAGMLGTLLGVDLMALWFIGRKSARMAKQQARKALAILERKRSGANRSSRELSVSNIQHVSQPS